MAESLNPIKPFKDVKRRRWAFVGYHAWHYGCGISHLSIPLLDPTSPSTRCWWYFAFGSCQFSSSLQDARTECQWSNNLNNKHCLLDILTAEAGFQKGTDRSGIGWRPSSWFIDGCLLIVPSCGRENNILLFFSYYNPHTHEDSLWLNLQMSS